MLLRSGEEDWFAQLRLVFSCTDEGGAEHRCAFVRGLCEAEEGELPMQRLRWATTTSPSGATIAWYDVVDICTIRGPVLLQEDPTEDELLLQQVCWQMISSLGWPMPLCVSYNVTVLSVKFPFL